MDVLKKLNDLENEATDFGFKWENAEQIIAQIRSELKEIEVHINNPAENHLLQEEIGDLLHAAFSLCIFCQFNAKETLSNSVDKFENRFRETKRLTNIEGLRNLNSQSFSKLMEIWEKAKEIRK